MQISLDTYAGRCKCGREHGLETKIAIIEPGATSRLDEVAEQLGLTGGGCVICDRNTRTYADRAAAELDGRLHPAMPLIQLDPEGLHADEHAVAAVETRLPADAAWLLAAGAGTIHDTTRYIACRRKIPFLSFPTAASVDGFVSSVCAMTWHGYKTTLPGVAPVALVADTEIFRRAPYRLTASGIGDVLGKYTSLADWEIAHLLVDEPICPAIYDLTRSAVDQVMESLDAIRAGEAAGCERLMLALTLSGIAMQLWGDSRPASAAEHHLSHLWEMEVLNPHVDALHGEKVGVGTIIVCEEMERLAALENPAAHVHPYAGLPEAMLREKFGELYDGVVRENTPDPMDALSPQTLAARYDDVRAVLAKVPGGETLRAAMERAGCLTTMEQLGLDPAIRDESVDLCPYVRARLTMMRIRKILTY